MADSSIGSSSSRGASPAHKRRVQAAREAAEGGPCFGSRAMFGVRRRSMCAHGAGEGVFGGCCAGLHACWCWCQAFTGTAGVTAEAQHLGQQTHAPSGGQQGRSERVCTPSVH
jgi:hypothetical protein